MKISNSFLYKFYILISTKWDNFIEDMFGMGSGEKNIIFNLTLSMSKKDLFQ